MCSRWQGDQALLLQSVDKETKEVMAVEEAVSAQEKGREGRAYKEATSVRGGV